MNVKNVKRCSPQVKHISTDGVPLHSYQDLYLQVERLNTIFVFKSIFNLIKINFVQFISSCDGVSVIYTLEYVEGNSHSAFI